MRKRNASCSSLRLAAFILISVSWIAAAEELPTTMIHVVIKISGSDIAADSFFAKPKTFWRASNRYCRSDEEPDPEQDIHGRLIINEPDAWLINLANSTAKHMVDPGPTFNCHLPIFAMDEAMARGKIGELEIGHELDFFRANGATVVDGPKLEFAAKYYELTIGDSILRLVERLDIHAPILVGLLRQGKSYQARYVLWEELPFKKDLFAPPSGMKNEELK